MIRVDHTPLRRLMMIGAAAGAVSAVEATATGNPLTFETELAKPLRSLLIPFTPVQEGSGDASPQNIRNILPWNGLTAFGGGKNLFDKTNGTDGFVWWEGQLAVGYNDYFASNKIPVVPGAKYTLKKDVTGQNQCELFDVNGDYVSQSTNMMGLSVSTFTIPDGVYFIAFNINEAALDTAQLEVGQTATAYEPYVPVTECPVVFPAMGNNLFNKNDPEVKTGVWWKGNILTSASYNNYKASEKIPVTAGETYTLTRQSTQQGAVCYFDKDGIYVDQQTWDRYTPSRQIPEGIAFITFTVEADHIDEAMFNKGSTALPYEPFDNTVYGGALNLVSGVMTVEWAGISKLWSDGDSATDMGSGITRKAFPMVDNLTTGSANNMCNVAPYSANESAATHFYYSGSGATNRNARVFLPSDTPGETPVVIITKLSQAREIQLTPQQITALVGDNTIWSDANGQMTAVYLKKR